MAEQRSSFRDAPCHRADTQKLEEEPSEPDYRLGHTRPKGYNYSDKNYSDKNDTPSKAAIPPFGDPRPERSQTCTGKIHMRHFFDA
jgi:hypothetical protein